MNKFKKFWEEDHSDYIPQHANYYSEMVAEYVFEYKELEIQSLKEKLSQYESGHKGTCSTCEVVGELNVELEKRLERTREIIKTVYLLSNEIFLTPVNPTNSEKRRITRLTYQIMESLNNWLTQNNQTKENEK